MLYKTYSREVSMEIIVRGNEQLGQALRRFRKQEGWTQDALSDTARIEQAIISKIESGVRQPELKTLFHLCSVLGVEIVFRKRKEEA